MTQRIALIWSEGNGGHPELVTDSANLEVFSVDERQPDDRVYRYTTGIRRVTPEVFAAFVSGTVHVLGEKPVVEQAARARIAAYENGGRPALSLAPASEPDHG